ncbi:Gram-positive signal peptide protein, YSIRK family [Lactobacillus crispatus CTV-05]|nr:YSIRK-type signal peptide-containing protein [Lactobacillus crispatus]EFQ44729.1 Gram-positive signal peptide protein, YSIRK family [Lactobacillus crispatus CTV-05]
MSFNTKFNGKQKFGFRKLSVGLAAVALSTTFFLSNSQLVHADTNTATNEEQTQQDSQKSNQEQSNNTIQSTQADPSNQNNQSSAKDSPNQEKTKQQTVEITAFHTDEKGNNASEIKKDESASLMAGQGLLKETKTFSWNGQIKGSSDSETEQTKTISYVINHIYANGSQKSNTPFASDEVMLKLKSEDSGQSWTQYSIDNGKTWNALAQAYTVTVSPNKNANAKYVADLVNIVTPDKIRLNNQHQFIIASSTPDGTHYELTIPYYITQHADVRFYDDTDKTDQAINKLLNDNGFQLSMTSDEAGQGLSADYQNKDDQSANTPIQFSRVEEALALFKNKHYKIEKVSGANATLKTDSSIGFGNFDNNENVDQHFIIYLVHETQIEKQTATVREEVKGYYVNGLKSQNFSGINNPDVAVPKNDETPTPNVVKEVIYSRSRVVDLVKDPQAQKQTGHNEYQTIKHFQLFRITILQLKT